MNVKMEVAVDKPTFATSNAIIFSLVQACFSKVSAVISLPRYAGKQWSTSALEAALATSRSMPEKPEDLLAAPQYPDHRKSHLHSPGPL
jgi:hypothetical protein